MEDAIDPVEVPQFLAQLPQFEDRFLYHLVDLTGASLPSGPLVGDGVQDIEIAQRMSFELQVAPGVIPTQQFFSTRAYSAIAGAIEELEDEGLIKVLREETGPRELRPTRRGRDKVRQWKEQWSQNKTKHDKRVRCLILDALNEQWRSAPEDYKLRSHLDVNQFCEDHGIDQDTYMVNAYRLLEQGKVASISINGAGPANGMIYITESGRSSLESGSRRPQPSAEEAWNEVAQLRRRLQLAERDLPSLISDEQLKHRCRDLLEAGEHYDRVVREACVILEDRVRQEIEAEKNVVGVNLMRRAFSPKVGPIRLSGEEEEQKGIMNMYAGLMAFFRNSTGHNVIDTYDQQEALQFVVLVDLLLSMVKK